MKKSLLIGIYLFGALFVGRLYADVIAVYPNKDNTLYENSNGLLSNGSGEGVFVGKSGQGVIRRALLQFDIAGEVPPGSKINAVFLTLHMSRTSSGPQEVSLHRVLADWGEGSSVAGGGGGGGATATPGDTTWLHTFYNTSFWTAPGGDFVVTPGDSKSVDQPGFYSWGSTSLMAADVQEWLDNPASNFGWVLVGNEAAAERTSKRFDSRENPTVSFRPTLTIDYTALTFGLDGDLNGDLVVNWADLKIFASQWLKGDSRADIDTDSDVDFADFALLAQNWLEIVVPPTADFFASPISGNAPLTVGFTDLSGGDITSWSWDFGDGGTSHARNPIYDYASAGIYTVSLKVAGPAGTDTVTKTDYISVTETPATISIETIGNFSYYPGDVKSIRGDIFRQDHFSAFAVLVHLADRGLVDMEYHFDASMNTYVVDSINGLQNWWYKAHYDGGRFERNAVRMDHYPYKDKMGIQIVREDPAVIANIYSGFTEEMARKQQNGGQVIIPRVTIRGRTTTLDFYDVLVEPHNLRSDTFQDGVVTAIDTILSLSDQGKITYELQWFDSIGNAEVVKSYWVSKINEDQMSGRCGFVYKTGSGTYKNLTIHIPSDWRVTHSPEFARWYWIELGPCE